MNFRALKAEEIDCRVAQTFNNPDGTIKGITLLLYKDARCDMNVLDESGLLWQRRHYECKGNLFCSVGINIEGEWIWKDDCGTESPGRSVPGRKKRAKLLIALSVLV